MVLGRIEYEERNMAESKRWFLAALEQFRAYGLKSLESNAHRRLGPIYMLEGETQQAIESLNQATRIAREIRNHHELAGALCNLAWARSFHQLTPESVQLYHQAIDMGTAVGNRHVVMISHSSLGSLYRKSKAFEPALTHLTKALAIAREIGDRRIEGGLCGYGSYL